MSRSAVSGEHLMMFANFEKVYNLRIRPRRALTHSLARARAYRSR
jgi:hypothetical protein